MPLTFLERLYFKTRLQVVLSSFFSSTMYCLVVVSALVAVSSATPLPCCMPDQFSGLLQQLGGAIGTNETQGHVMDVSLFSRCIFATV